MAKESINHHRAKLLDLLTRIYELLDESARIQIHVFTAVNSKRIALLEKERVKDRYERVLADVAKRMDELREGA